MNAEKMKKSIYTVVFTVIITTVFISALSYAHLMTKDRIQLNKKLVFRKAILAAAGIVLPEDAGQIVSLYERSVVEMRLPDNAGPYFQVRLENQVAAFVFIADGPGLWGRIHSLIGYDTELKEITGFEIMDQNETPGLGGRIVEEWFRYQFIGKTGPFTSLVNEKEKNGPLSFASVTGATASSNAVRELINKTIDEQVEAIRRLPGEER